MANANVSKKLFLQKTCSCYICTCLSDAHQLQVVVVRGINPAGACIVVHDIYTAVPFPMPQSSLDQMRHFAEATGDSRRVWKRSHSDRFNLCETY